MHVKLPNQRGEWRCTLCQQWKPATAFPRDKHHRNGLTSHCKPCCNTYHTNYIQTLTGPQRERYLKYQADYQRARRLQAKQKKETA